MKTETARFLAPVAGTFGRWPMNKDVHRVWLLCGLLVMVAACASSRAVGGDRRDRDRGTHGEEARSMKDREDFVAWVKGSLYRAELALHNGDPAPRRALWSRREPVSVYGAWRNARGQAEIDALFAHLGSSFSNCTSYAFELQTYDVVGDMAYTVGLEHSAVSVDGKPRTYTLRVTQVYRREDGEWKVVHRHGDELTDPHAR
jgi:ketosteroid isomerase-like protein